MIGRDKIGLETRKHMRRSAKIDRIAAIAGKTSNAKLLEKVQRLRDQEAKRHAKVLARLAKTGKDGK